MMCSPVLPSRLTIRSPFTMSCGRRGRRMAGPLAAMNSKPLPAAMPLVLDDWVSCFTSGRPVSHSIR